MAPQDTCRTADLLRKLFDERAFSGPGLPADKRNLSGPMSCVVQVSRQFFELSLAFEQGHDAGPVSIKRTRLKRCQPPFANWGYRRGNLGISPDLRPPAALYRVT